MNTRLSKTKSPKPRRTAKAAGRKLRDGTTVTFRLLKTGFIKVSLRGKDAGNLNPSREFPGCYYASIRHPGKGLFFQNKSRWPVDLAELKKNVVTFLT